MKLKAESLQLFTTSNDICLNTKMARMDYDKFSTPMQISPSGNRFDHSGLSTAENGSPLFQTPVSTKYVINQSTPSTPLVIRTSTDINDNEIMDLSVSCSNSWNSLDSTSKGIAKQVPHGTILDLIKSKIMNSGVPASHQSAIMDSNLTGSVDRHGIESSKSNGYLKLSDSDGFIDSNVLTRTSSKTIKPLNLHETNSSNSQLFQILSSQRRASTNLKINSSINSPNYAPVGSHERVVTVRNGFKATESDNFSAFQPNTTQSQNSFRTSSIASPTNTVMNLPKMELIEPLSNILLDSNNNGLNDSHSFRSIYSHVIESDTPNIYIDSITTTCDNSITSSAAFRTATMDTHVIAGSNVPYGLLQTDFGQNYSRGSLPIDLYKTESTYSQGTGLIDSYKAGLPAYQRTDYNYSQSSIPKLLYIDSHQGLLKTHDTSPTELLKSQNPCSTKSFYVTSDKCKLAENVIIPHCEGRNSADVNEKALMDVADFEKIPVEIWSFDQVSRWMEKCCRMFCITPDAMEGFRMNGAALCFLEKEDFQRRSPQHGDVLYNALQRLHRQQQQKHKQQKQIRQQKQTKQQLLQQNAPQVQSELAVNCKTGENYEQSGRLTNENSLEISFKTSAINNLPSSINSSSKQYTSINESPCSIQPRECSVTSSLREVGDVTPHDIERNGEWEWGRNGREKGVDSDSEMALDLRVTSSLSTSSVSCDSTDHQLQLPESTNADSMNEMMNLTNINENLHRTGLMVQGEATPLLWEFLVDLLETGSSPCVCWDLSDQEGLTFQIVDQNELAALWGNQKRKQGMTYEKLSRALRYYYRHKILIKVPGKQLTYRFLKAPRSIEKARRGAKPGVPHKRRQPLISNFAKMEQLGLSVRPSVYEDICYIRKDDEDNFHSNCRILSPDTTNAFITL